MSHELPSRCFPQNICYAALKDELALVGGRQSVSGFLKRASRGQARAAIYGSGELRWEKAMRWDIGRKGN